MVRRQEGERLEEENQRLRALLEQSQNQAEAILKQYEQEMSQSTASVPHEPPDIEAAGIHKEACHTGPFSRLLSHATNFELVTEYRVVTPSTKVLQNGLNRT